MDSPSLQFKDLSNFLSRLHALTIGAVMSSIMATGLFDHMILPDIKKFLHSERFEEDGKLLFGSVASFFVLTAVMAFSWVFVVYSDAAVIGASLNTSKPSAENC